MRSSSPTGSQDGTDFGSQEEKQKGHLRNSPYELFVIGLGSGGPEGVTVAAKKALSQVDTVIGYKLYLEQAAPLLSPNVKLESSGMTAETKRAEEALARAMKGERVAVVSGGDPGVYAMAGVVFEVAADRKLPLGTDPGELKITVVAGTPALTNGAALLGAPITHDFCAISLSDRLTDWELIKKRLTLASRGDFVIILYNPRSHGRATQLGEAKSILLENMSPDTPVGLASRCGRDGQNGTIVTLGTLEPEEVDMQTLVIIGNSTTFVYRNHMITPRGYLSKYGDSQSQEV